MHTNAAERVDVRPGQFSNHADRLGEIGFRPLQVRPLRLQQHHRFQHRLFPRHIIRAVRVVPTVTGQRPNSFIGHCGLTGSLRQSAENLLERLGNQVDQRVWIGQRAVHRLNAQQCLPPLADDRGTAPELMKKVNLHPSPAYRLKRANRCAKFAILAAAIEWQETPSLAPHPRPRARLRSPDDSLTQAYPALG